MAISPSSPLTGSAITGLTSPTYTLTSDTPPDVNSKAWVVTALGGTQTGVIVHKNEMPFRIIAKRPKTVKVPGARNSVTGQFIQTGKNEYSIVVVKGVNVLNGMSNAQYETIVARVTLAVPAAVGNDESQLSALASCLGGLIANQIQGIKDTSLNSVL